MLASLALAGSLLSSPLPPPAVPAQAAGDVPLDAVRARLEGDPYLKGVPWQLVPGADGLVFVVQPPASPVDGHAADVAARIQGPVAPVLEHVEAEYLRPFGLARARGYEAVPIVVLSDWAAFSEYERARPADFDSCYTGRFGYDRGLCAPVVYLEQGLSTMSDRDVQREVGTPLVLAQLQAVRGERVSPYHWYAVGLAASVADLERAEDGGLRDTPLPATLESGVATLVREGRAPILWNALPDLMRVEGWNYLWTSVTGRCARAGVDPPDGSEVYLDYGRECYALVRYLDQGGRRAGFRRFLSGTMRGRSGSYALLKELGVGDLETLDGDFRSWLGDAIGVAVPPLGRYAPAAPEGAAPAAAPEPEHDPAAASAPASVDAAAASPALEAAEEACGALAVAGTDPAVDRALAVALAAEGRYDEARAALGPGEDPATERLAAWLDAWRALRDAYLADLVKSGDTARIELDGERTNVRVLAVEDGRVTLVRQKGGKRTLALEALDGVPLALAIGSRDADRLVEGGAWKRGIPLAVAGHDLARRTLRGGGEEAERILAASGSELPAERERGRTALALDELARHAEGLEVADVAPLLERLGTVARSLAGDPVLSARLDAARAAARSLLAVEVAARGVGAIVHGRTEELPADGALPARIRVTWDLSDPAQVADLQDFAAFDWRFREITPTVLPESEWRREQEKADLMLTGRQGLALPIELGPPLRMRVEYSSFWKEGMPGLRVVMDAGFATEDGASYVLGNNGNYLEYGIRRVSRPMNIATPPQTFAGQGYDLELAYDGEEEILTFAGAELARQKAERVFVPPHPRGVPFVCVSTDIHVLLKRIVVEGVPSDRLPAHAVEAWIDARTTELFGE